MVVEGAMEPWLDPEEVAAADRAIWQLANSLEEHQALRPLPGNQEQEEDMPERSLDPPICKHFLNGYCWLGTQCYLRHPEGMEKGINQPICK